MLGRVDPGVRLALPALAWLAGSAAQLAQPALWGRDVYIGIGLFALLLALPARRRGWWAMGPLAIALLAFSSTGWRAGERLADRLDAGLEGRDLTLTGVIDSLPQPGANAIRFRFAVEQALADGEPVKVPPRVSLAWYSGEGGEAPDLRAGQRWRLVARLKRPHGSRNPQGFDLELWLFERGIGASGYVRSAGVAPQRLGDAIGAPIERARQAWRDAIQARVADPRAAGVIAALAVGDQGAIHRSDWELFRQTGIAHLVSISGLHVTMFAWLASAVIGALWRRLGRLCLWLPAPHAARWGGLALAAAYALLAGWGVPAQRTVWMIGLVVGLRSLGLRWPLPLVLLVVAAAVALIDPWALLQPGFWLSFTAVALLIAAAPTERADEPALRWPARLWAAALAGLRTQWVATIGLAPLTMLFFQQVSLVGFAANLIAIPVVTLLITPLSLLGLLWPPLWSLAAAAVQALTAVLGGLGSWPFAVWTAAAAPWWAAAAGLLGGTLLVAPLPWRARWLGLPLLLPLLWPAVPRPDDGRFDVVAVDVGQGTAVIVRTRTRLLVYDTGPQYSAESDAGERLLLPLLRARGERHIDLLMLSHRDSDHVGGAASVLARLPVRAMSSSLAEEHPLRAPSVPHEPCRAGQRWTWDGVRFDVLHPPGPATAATARANTVSCVLRVEDARGRSLLLTGDIEAAQEAALVVHDAASLRSTALLVPHHGSRTSSSAVFLDAVAPAVAVVQADYRSRFGHPAPDVLARYAARGIAVQRSDRCGAWTWDGNGPGQCERQRSRRYWHHGP